MCARTPRQNTKKTSCTGSSPTYYLFLYILSLYLFCFFKSSLYILFLYRPSLYFVSLQTLSICCFFIDSLYILLLNILSIFLVPLYPLSIFCFFICLCFNCVSMICAFLRLDIICLCISYLFVTALHNLTLRFSTFYLFLYMTSHYYLCVLCLCIICIFIISLLHSLCLIHPNTHTYSLFLSASNTYTQSPKHIYTLCTQTHIQICTPTPIHPSTHNSLFNIFLNYIHSF